jgi:hypothetical protein
MTPNVTPPILSFVGTHGLGYPKVWNIIAYPFSFSFLPSTRIFAEEGGDERIALRGYHNDVQQPKLHTDARTILV